MTISFDDLVHRLRQSHPSWIDGHVIAIPTLRDEHNWRHIAWNIGSLAEATLRYAMFQVRIDDDLETAFRTLMISNQYSVELAEMIEAGDKFSQNNLAEIQDNWELASDFTSPIYCCLLSGNVPLAQRLAQAVMAIKLPQDPDWFDVTAHLLSAFVLDNRALFSDLWPIYEKLHLYYGQKILDDYMQLYKAVLRRDTAEYARLLKKVSEEFHLREKDKKLEDFGEYGGPSENAFVLDFMALGIAYVAHLRGMSIGAEIDTEFFPLEFFKKQCGLTI